MDTRAVIHILEEWLYKIPSTESEVCVLESKFWEQAEVIRRNSSKLQAVKASEQETKKDKRDTRL